MTFTVTEGHYYWCRSFHRSHTSYMGVNHAGRGKGCPHNLEWGALMQIAPPLDFVMF